MKRKLLLFRAIVPALVLLTCLLGVLPSQAQGDGTVKGTVHGENNQPLADVTVEVRNSQTNFQTATKTNSSGQFTITAPAGDSYEFTFTSVGFEPFTISGYSIKSGQTNTLDADMKITTATLEQVVVVGYGTQKRRDVTGSVASVNLETMKNSPNTNIGQFLQGTVPGLNVGVSLNAGGTPPISIRGQVTLSGNRNVLIILDGIQYGGSLSSINPDDIASIDILKDASSTAVYGAQAANGVMLITSKKGKAGQKIRVAYSGSYSTQRPTVDLRPMNREEYLQKVTNAFWTQAYMGPDYTQPNPAFDVSTKIDQSPWSKLGYARGTDFSWWKEGTHTGSILENNLSISGGSENVSYLLSGSLGEQDNFIKNDLFKRKTIRANLEIRPVKFWRIGLISSASFVNQDGSEPTLSELMQHSPLLVPFDSLGVLIPSPTNSVLFNPFRTYYVDDRDRNQYYFANVYSDLDIPFIKGLNYRLNFGNNLNNAQHYFASQYGGGFTGQAYKDNRQLYDYTFDNILTYKKAFGKHDFTLTALYGAVKREFEGTYVEGVNFSRLNLSYNGIGSASTITTSPSAWTEALSYQMGRLNYKYDDKYILTATLRRDGFSGFAENNKSAVFPSLGLGWLLSSEKFLESVSFVNFLKLRATYGAIGNQTGRYSSLARVTTNASYVFGDGGGTAFGQQVASLPNPNLKWERTQGLDLGLDFTLLNSRLNGTLDYYSNNTYDLLYSVTVPGITGFGSIQTNVGQMRNIGFEANLTYQIVRRKDFNWSVTYNFWTNKNEVVKLTGIDANGDGREDDVVETGSGGLFIGKAVGTIFDYEKGTIYQVGETPMSGFYTGSFRVIDQNKDGDITNTDRTFLGQTGPRFRMSLYNNVSYKGFTLSFLLNSIQGGKNGYLANNTRVFFRDDNSIRDNDVAGVDFWSPLNPNGKYPRYLGTTASKVQPPMYQSRNFVRLQDISLGYSLPSNLLQKIKANEVSVYVSGKNVATWTKWDGWDPEAGNSGQGLNIFGRPLMRAFTVGVRITY